VCVCVCVCVCRLHQQASGSSLPQATPRHLPCVSLASDMDESRREIEGWRRSRLRLRRRICCRAQDAGQRRSGEEQDRAPQYIITTRPTQQAASCHGLQHAPYRLLIVRAILIIIHHCCCWCWCPSPLLLLELIIGRWCRRRQLAGRGSLPLGLKAGAPPAEAHIQMLCWSGRGVITSTKRGQGFLIQSQTGTCDAGSKHVCLHTMLIHPPMH